MGGAGTSVPPVLLEPPLELLDDELLDDELLEDEEELLLDPELPKLDDPPDDELLEEELDDEEDELDDPPLLPPDEPGWSGLPG